MSGRRTIGRETLRSPCSGRRHSASGSKAAGPTADLAASTSTPTSCARASPRDASGTDWSSAEISRSSGAAAPAASLSSTSIASDAAAALPRDLVFGGGATAGAPSASPQRRVRSVFVSSKKASGLNTPLLTAPPQRSAARKSAAAALTTSPSARRRSAMTTARKRSADTPFAHTSDHTAGPLGGDAASAANLACSVRKSLTGMAAASVPRSREAGESPSMKSSLRAPSGTSPRERQPSSGSIVGWMADNRLRGGRADVSS